MQQEGGNFVARFWKMRIDGSQNAKTFFILLKIHHVNNLQADILSGFLYFDIYSPFSLKKHLTTFWERRVIVLWISLTITNKWGQEYP